MDALTILIIRHAEKPGEDWPGSGLTSEGGSDDKSLVIRGWQRAGAWAALFGTGLNSQSYPRPAVVYAVQPGDGANAEDGPSKRPAETVSPLCARLGQAAKTNFALGAERDLMKEVLALTGTVLIAWEHKAIVSAILPHIPTDAKLPSKWPGTRFDVVFRFDRPAGAEQFAFRQLFPQLLSGDSTTPI